MKRLLLAAACILSLAGCSDPPGATDTLSSAGYKDIKTTGYSFFGCGEDDFYHTGFTALGLDGVRIRGAVCGGLFFKGDTIRVFGRVR
jgi:hypothetical protein